MDKSPSATSVSTSSANFIDHLKPTLVAERTPPTPECVSAGLVILNRGLSKAVDQVHRGRVEKLLLPLWYMQLGWPDRFGLSKDQGRELLARFKNVVQAFGITNESEGPIGNMSRFLADMDARYGKKLEGAATL